MKTETASFTFKVPTDEANPHPDAGKKMSRVFEFKVCETEEEAKTVLAEKKWSLLELVNDVLKANARSNSYQAALAPYKPSEVSAEDIKERMIRDYIRLNIPEDIARKQVEAVLAAMATQKAAETEEVEA